MRSITLRSFLPSLTLMAALAFLAGCDKSGTADAKKTAAAEETGVVATIGETKITRDELEDEILKQILANTPDALEQVLNRKIDQKVLDLEAAKQKVTREALLEREVKAKVATGNVTQAEIDAFYEQNKARIPVPKEQVVGQIRQHLEGQRQQEAYTRYMEGLRAQYGVRNSLKEVLAKEEEVKAAENRPLIEGKDVASAGPANAAVTLVEFSDFECPYCTRVVPIIDGVKKNYGDKVRVVFQQFPLNAIHPKAQKAAEAALCAQEQGKFWELHDALFKDQSKLEVPAIKATAQTLGLDAQKFATCLDGGQMAPKVAESLALGEKVGVTGTPALFLNGKPVKGTPSYEQLASEIDKLLAPAKS